MLGEVVTVLRFILMGAKEQQPLATGRLIPQDWSDTE